MKKRKESLAAKKPLANFPTFLTKINAGALNLGALRLSMFDAFNCNHTEVLFLRACHSSLYY